MNQFAKWRTGICVFTAILIKANCTDYPENCVAEYSNSQITCKNVTCLPPISDNVKRSITTMKLTDCSQMISDDNDWNGYMSLRNLSMHFANIVWQRGKLPLDKFSKLTNLTRLQIVNSSLTDQEMWVLPKQLEIYDVSYNQYTYLNVSMCPNIQHVYADHNKLTKMPILSDPLPPIETLSLLNNPLDEITIQYVASLCQLSRLDLAIPSNSFLQTLNGTCLCLRLREWIAKYVRSTRAMLHCLKLPSEMKCDLTFDDMGHLRERRNKYYGPPGSLRLADLFIFLLSIVILVSIIFGITLLGYHSVVAAR